MMEIVRDFTALLVIGTFDNMVFNALKDEIMKEVLDLPRFQIVCLQINRTTSDKAEALDEPNNDNYLINKRKNPTDEDYIKVDKEVGEEELDVPEKAFVKFADRLFWNKCAYLLYKLIHMLHISIWFYFLPMLFFYGQYLIPRSV